MPNISTRGQEMPASPIRKLMPYAIQAKAAGKKVYHLNIGQPDILTPQMALDAVKQTDLKVLAYSPSNGFASYREKLAAYYATKNIDLGADDIMITTGGSEAILFTMMSCLEAGDEVIIPEPCYANYNGFAHASGVKVVPVTANIEQDFALPPIAAFEALITSKTKAILICNPSNPTGYLYSSEELEVLKDIVLKHDLFLIVDEVYREFTYDNAIHHSILNVTGLEQHAIVVDSVSKRYSMCGARIGALISRNETVLSTALKFGQARLSPPTFAQLAAEGALDTPQTYFDGVVKEYEARRNTLVNGLRKIEGVVCPMPKGAFYVIAQLPVADTEDFCRWLLAEFEHEGETVMLAPAAGFYATKGLGKQEVRIAYVLNETDLKKALVCLEKGLMSYEL